MHCKPAVRSRHHMFNHANQRETMKIKFAVLVLALVSSTGCFAEDVVAKAKASGVVTMGVREASSPLSYTLGNGQYTGFHVDVCKRIIANIEKAAGRKLDIKYQAVTSQNRGSYVQNGTVDLECGSTTNTLERQADHSFLVTAFVEETRIVVKANSNISSFAMLNGKNVVTTSGTTTSERLAKGEKMQNMKFKKVMGRDHAESFQMLESDRAEAFVMDSAILRGLMASASKPSDFKIVGEPLGLEPIAIMISKKDPGLKKLGDDTMIDMMKSGDMAKLWDKWFVQPIPPKNARVNFPVNAGTKAAWANPNDKPAETYAK